MTGKSMWDIYIWFFHNITIHFFQTKQKPHMPLSGSFKTGDRVMKVKWIILISLALFILTFPKIIFAGDDEEIKFGFYTDREVVATRTILFNDALNKRITEIGNRVTKSSGKSDMRYTFWVINDPTIGAYSAAGGFVYINTGLLDILESEDELASIMAHEIAHINKSHQINFIYALHRGEVAKEIMGAVTGGMLGALFETAATRYSYSYRYSYLSTTGPMFDLGYRMGEPMGKGIGTAIAVSMIKGYGKDQELEADALAVRYTKKAGYDPNALVSVFKKLISERNRLGINEKNYVSSLINAEPGLEERIKNAEELILKAK